jgi:hypothetical protein
MFINVLNSGVPGKGYSFTPETGITYKITCMYKASQEVLINLALFILKGDVLQGNSEDDLLYTYFDVNYGLELTQTSSFTSNDGSDIRLLLCDYGLNDLSYTIIIKKVIEVDRTHAFLMNRNLGAGMNLGNMFDAPSIGEWGVEPDADFLAILRARALVLSGFR